MPHSLHRAAGGSSDAFWWQLHILDSPTCVSRRSSAQWQVGSPARVQPQLKDVVGKGAAVATGAHSILQSSSVVTSDRTLTACSHHQAACTDTTNTAPAACCRLATVATCCCPASPGRGPGLPHLVLLQVVAEDAKVRLLAHVAPGSLLPAVCEGAALPVMLALVGARQHLRAYSRGWISVMA